MEPLKKGDLAILVRTKFGITTGHIVECVSSQYADVFGCVRIDILNPKCLDHTHPQGFWSSPVSWLRKIAGPGVLDETTENREVTA